MKNATINRGVIKIIARALGELNEQVIYVGGATVGLYINDPAADDVRPTAIYCSSDRIAARAISGILDMGYKVPQDISVMGFDNQRVPDEEYTGPRITGIKQPLYEMGVDSVRTITDILNGQARLPITQTYDTSLVEYDTVCEPRL